MVDAFLLVLSFKTIKFDEITITVAIFIDFYLISIPKMTTFAHPKWGNLSYAAYKKLLYNSTY